MKHVILMVAFVGALGACGGRQRARTLEAYEAESARCSDNIDAIVAREGTTRDEDLSALAAEQDRCFTALEAIMGGVR